MRLTLTVPLLVMLVSSAFAQPRISQADLLRRLTDLDRLLTPPVGEHTGMFSSYDRRSRIDDAGNYANWTANDDLGQFIRAESDGWLVMAEMRGPGAITRIWSTAPQGDIRLILDGKIVLDTQFENVFNGRLPPFGQPLCYVTPAGGNNCYFPIGFNQSCKVVTRNAAACYQFNYVSFAAGTEVETFDPKLSEDASATLDEVSRTLTRGLTDSRLFRDLPTYPVSNFATLRPTESLEIETLGGGGVIRALHVGLTDRRLPPEPYALHQCILRVFVDNEKRPSVEAPLVDFFGSGFGMSYYRSLVLGTDKRTSMPGRARTDDFFAGAETGPPLPGEAVNENRFMYCYFPMPFNDVARVEIENLSGKKIGIMLWARVDRSTPPANMLRFRAHFRQENPCRVPEYSILEAAGRGRIVGCTLSVDCPRKAWWGEGDARVWIDGEAFPSYFGTGTEGYLGDARGLSLRANALQGVTRTGPYGKNSAYRWHITDCINFHESVRFTIENLQPRNVRDTYFGSVVYWYGDPAGTYSFEPLTLDDLKPPGLRIPGAVELETGIVGDGWGNVVREKYAGGVEFSGRRAANVTGKEPVHVTIPFDRDCVVRLKLRVHPRRPFETITVVDAAGRTVGTVSYDRTANGMYTVGLIRLSAGDNQVVVRCTPKAILDCWILEETPMPTESPALP